MKCHICGGNLNPTRTDLPFKRDEKSIVILKDIPIFQCENCQEYLIEDPVMAEIESIMATVNPTAELEIFRYAA
ncbi:MAG: type II toxin-antitoxin system MqsA family antitoxin [Acidobacteria bacterium]|jgi:YgiT-type zinc finger domain-containing protein|nr:type II toxin-antitoxin system MqsA family antitoxin [Acidobacteriota bacterium]